MSEEYDDGRGLDPRTRADIEQIAAAALAEDGQDPLDEATRLAIRHRHETELTAWLAPDGFALLIDAELSLVVRPEARGEGLGGTLLGLVLEVAADEPLNAWSHGDHPAAALLAARTAFTRARDLWVMRLDVEPLVEEVAQPDHSLVEEVAKQPLVPEEVAQQPSRRARDPADEITIRSWRPTDEDELLRVNAAAFADHPEQGAMDAANLAQRMAEPWFDPAGLLVAEEDGRLLGFHWTKVHPDGGGEVYVVAVDPAAQGRGLGRQLTRAGLDHLARVGVPDVHLYVEADNTAAVKLYERLGFTHAAGDTHVQYHRQAG